MGIGIVLLMWAVVGTVLACVGALIFGATTMFLTRKATKDRTLTLFASIAFPFGCVGWAALLFVVQALVNGTMHRDVGLGDSWDCPLPNGYAITMIDFTDRGWVYNPKTQSGGLSDQDDAVSDVLVLQVAGRYILGGADSRSAQEQGNDINRVNSYFILDTITGKKTLFSTIDELRGASQPLGIQPNLQPINAVYSKYRFTWFDILVGVLLVVPPIIYFAVLVMRIRRLRQSATAC